MKEFTEKVLILRVGRFREADLWVRFLSPTRGIMSAFAFGGSRSRRRFSGCLDTFNEVSFSLKVTRNGLYTSLQEGLLVQSPQRLRNDWQRLGVATNCGKFVEAFGVAPDGAGKAYNLVADTLALLERDHSFPGNFPLFFRLKFVFEQGYPLYFNKCSQCGKFFADMNTAIGERICFFVSEGSFVCGACGATQKNGIFLPVSHETLDALALVQEYSPLCWQQSGLGALSPSVQRDLARLIDAFIEHHIGLHWDNNRFVRV